MTDTVLGAIIGVGGTILGVILAGPLTYHISKVLVRKTHENETDLMKRQEFYRAASKFRSAILYELVGFFPIDQYWEEKDFPRIYQSIPRIKSAAVEFRFFVKSKDAFDTSVKDYDEYCRKTTYQDVTAYAMYKDSMYKPEDKGPREKFNHIVENLLLYAKEK